jgi:hypothetical protein
MRTTFYAYTDWGTFDDETFTPPGKKTFLTTEIEYLLDLVDEDNLGIANFDGILVMFKDKKEWAVTLIPVAKMPGPGGKSQRKMPSFLFGIDPKGEITGLHQRVFKNMPPVATINYFLHSKRWRFYSAVVVTNVCRTNFSGFKESIKNGLATLRRNRTNTKNKMLKKKKLPGGTF